MKQLITALTLSSALLLAGESFAENHWSSDVGGNFNIPPKEYNPNYHAYGSYGQKIYNKIDLQNGNNMQITGGKLYDNQGNVIGTAKDSVIGSINGGADGRDGGIIAGGITKMVINGNIKRMIYAWSVNITEGGRKSGWVELGNFKPRNGIRKILQRNVDKRLALIQDSLNDADYAPKVVKSATLPSEAEEWYLTPNRTGNAGKAKYYFTREGLISGLKNIPETGSQRYGVAHDAAPIGTVFQMDRNVDEVHLNIYKPDSSTPTQYSLKLVWGYFKNNANKRIYSWVNSAALRNP